MKNIFIKSTLFVIAFFSFILFLNSCKKTGLGEIESNENIKDKNFVAQIKSEIEKNGLVQRVEVNQRITPMFVDINGNEISHSSISNITSTCGGDLPSIADLVYYEKNYQCNNGYAIKWFYNISWNNNIVAIANNPAFKTKGVVRVSIPGNSNAYNNTTFDVQIIDMGLNPDQVTYPGENIFSVSFMTTTIIPEGVLNAQGAILRLGATFYSDCTSNENYGIALGNAYGPNGTVVLGSSPCQRSEKVFIRMPDASSGSSNVRKLMFGGFDPLSLCTYQFSCDTRYPDYQEVQYTIDGGAWTNAANSETYPSWITGTSFLTRLTINSFSELITPGVHNFQVRTRNWQFNSCPTPNTTIPNSSNSCFTPVWSVFIYNNVTVL